MKNTKVIFSAMAAVGIFVTTFGATEYWRLDTVKEPTFGAYGSAADWWELSGAEVKRVGDALEIRNVDNNAIITSDEIARDLLGLPANAPITKKVATEAKQKLYEGKRAKGRVNHGLFSNKIPVDSQGVKIEFTARFNDVGGFVEISNSSAYGPYINTKDGKIVVDNGYESKALFGYVNPAHWYAFSIVLHDGRENNPVAMASVEVEDLTTREKKSANNVKLLCRKVDWYKVNFFPVSAYGKKMSIKDFKISAYQGETPKAEPLAKTETKPTATATYVHDKNAPITAPHVIDLLPCEGALRDIMVELGPDGNYYMCCSTGVSPENAKGEVFPRPKETHKDEGLWQDDTGIRIWKSADMIDWQPVRSGKADSAYPFYIWTIEECGTWEKINGFGVKNVNNGEQRFGEILWAPELHWIKGTYFIVYCMHPGGTAIARSVTGRPEGPYVRQECCQNTPFRNRIDASLFWDDDNTVYYVDGSCAIYKLNEDMTDIEKDGKGKGKYIASQAPGKEGGYLFKANGIYYATSAEFFSKRYDAVIGMNKTGKCMAKGAYKEVHYLYSCGHNGYFKDKDGNWWCTMFGNDNDPLSNKTNGFYNGFALVPIAFDPNDGHIYVDQPRLDAWNQTLLKRGFKFSK